MITAILRLAPGIRRIRGEETEVVRRGRGLAPAGHTELAQNVRYVHADGLGADEELLADLPVGAAGGDEAQHLRLPVGKPEPRGVANAHLRLLGPVQRDPGTPGYRVNVLEQRPGTQ